VAVASGDDQLPAPSRRGVLQGSVLCPDIDQDRRYGLRPLLSSGGRVWSWQRWLQTDISSNVGQRAMEHLGEREHDAKGADIPFNSSGCTVNNDALVVRLRWTDQDFTSSAADQLQF
jgi:hypothetical protein